MHALVLSISHAHQIWTGNRHLLQGHNGALNESHDPDQAIIRDGLSAVGLDLLRSTHLPNLKHLSSPITKTHEVTKGDTTCRNE